MTHSYPMLNRYVIPDMPSADELLPYLRQIDDNRWYSNFGPLICQFEQRLTAYLSACAGNPQGEPISLVSLASCYHALQIGLQIFRMPANAQVLVPAVTFPACPLAVHHAGATAVLADIDLKTWQLTPQTARLAAKTMPIRAVMPVAVYGVPVPVDAWDAFTEETGIPVIIDAAAALEAQPIPRKALVAYSLHATKPFSIGEGGLLAGRNREQIDEARSIANFGTRSRIALQDGVNAKLSEYHGAVALAQMDRWESIKARRRDMFALYRKFVEALDLDLSFQHDIEQAIVSTLMLRTKAVRAKAVVNSLNGQGIAAHRMYLPPLYHHPYFAKLAVINNEGTALDGATLLEKKIDLMKNSETMHKTVFGLPFHSSMSEGDVAHVIKTVDEVMELPEAKLA